MNKGNSYRKLYYIDRFARAYYCRHARENQLRMDKKMAKKAARHNRKTIQDFEWDMAHNPLTEEMRICIESGFSTKCS